MTTPANHPSLPLGLTSPARWAPQLAAAAGLSVLLEERQTALLQMGLFALAVVLNSGWLSRWRLLKSFYLAVSVPVFLWLSETFQTQDELLAVRALYYVLLATLYTLPYLPLNTAKDLRRESLVLIACFFISATYFQSSFFLAAIWVAAFALFLAFFSIESTSLALRFRLSGGYLAAAGVGGIFLFLIFPRAWFSVSPMAVKMATKEQANPAMPGQDQVSEVGMSSRRDLLELARLIDFRHGNTEVLTLGMIAESTGARFTPSRSMYLRAAIFDQYLDGAWHAKPIFQTYYDEDDMVWDGWIRLPESRRHTNSMLIRQQIQAQTLEDICYSLPDPVAVRIPKIRFDPRGVLAFAYRLAGIVKYEVISEMPVSMDFPGLDTDPLSHSTNMQAYLQVPSDLKLLLKSQMEAWNLKGSPTSKARQLCHNLQTQFEYGSVSFTPLDGVDPVIPFLTESRQGYCSHFATVMALMARSIGLPARVASGFHFNGPPDANGIYRLFEHNAHAWTEIYFPKYGWVIFDATPAGSRPISEKMADTHSWRNLLDKLLRAHDLISEFGTADQHSVMMAVKHVFVVAAAWWRPRLISPWNWLGLALLGGVLWGIYRQLPARRRRLLVQWVASRPPASEVPFYADFLWVLGRYGLEKPPGSTGLEFAAHIRPRLEAPEVDGITRHFYGVKYGGKKLSPQDMQDIEQLLRSLERTLAERRNRSGSLLSPSGVIQPQ